MHEKPRLVENTPLWNRFLQSLDGSDGESALQEIMVFLSEQCFYQDTLYVDDRTTTQHGLTAELDKGGVMMGCIILRWGLRHVLNNHADAQVLTPLPLPLEA